MCRLVLVTLGFIFIAFGTLGLLFFPKLLQKKVEEKLILRIGTKQYDRFTNIPIPLVTKYYFFDIVNKEEVFGKNHAKPQFKEVGPFVFKQWRKRRVVDFTDNNAKLTFREYKTYYEASEQEAIEILQTEKKQRLLNTGALETYEEVYNNPHETNITIINVPLLGLLTKLSATLKDGLKRDAVAKLFNRVLAESKDKLLITQPAGKLLFGGYKVKFMEELRSLVTEKLSFNVEFPLFNDTFGFMYGKNGTWTKQANGELTIYTGQNNTTDKYMQVASWNGLTKHFVWPKLTPEDSCNRIIGTDGSSFHPGVTRDKILEIFSPMICTSVYIKYKEDTQAKGIPLYRFTTPPEVFGSPKKHPRNECYCSAYLSSMPSQADASSQSTSQATTSSGARISINNSPLAHDKRHQTTIAPNISSLIDSEIDDSRCYIDGLFDLSPCQKGAPIAASSPHFYNAERMLIAMTHKMEPNAERHATYVDIEPMTGVVMRAKSRAQINAYVDEAAVNFLDQDVIGWLPPMIAPVFWQEEGAEIDDKSALEFKTMLLDQVNAAKRAFKISILLGLIIIPLVLAHFLYVRWVSDSKLIDEKRKKQRKHNLPPVITPADVQYGKNAKTSNQRSRTISELEAYKIDKQLKRRDAKLLPPESPASSNAPVASTSATTEDDDDEQSKFLLRSSH